MTSRGIGYIEENLKTAREEYDLVVESRGEFAGYDNHVSNVVSAMTRAELACSEIQGEDLKRARQMIKKTRKYLK